MLLNCCCDEEVVCRPPPHPEGECPWSSWEHLAGASPLRWHRGCCRPGIGDVSLTTPCHRAVHIPPSPARRTSSPLSSILHLLPHGDPLRRSRGEPYTQTRTATTMPEPPAERSSARSPSPLCAHTLYRTHVRAAPIRPPRGPGQTHPHVLSPSGLPRAAWEASLFTLSLQCHMPPHIACDRHSPPHSAQPCSQVVRHMRFVLSLGHLPPPSRRPPHHYH